ncbi:MAG: hypothetical protein HY321_21520 [Armatimonadetes bacterium]|nr:hypothetical protein [Armatimonadota bacterium]
MRTSRFVVLPLALTAQCLLFGTAGAPESVRDLAARANSELRAAQSALFNGKQAECRAALDRAAALIQQIEQAEPDNVQLRGLKERLERQRRDLDRRAGSAGPAAPPAGGDGGTRPSAPLPRSVREKAREFDEAVRALQSRLRWVETAKEGGASKTPLQHAEEAEALLPRLQAAFEALKEEAAKAGVGTHPTIVEAERMATSLPETVRKAKSEAAAAAARQQTADRQAEADIAALKAEAERLRAKVFDKAPGAAIHYNDLAPVTELLATIEEFERSDRAGAQKLVDEFRGKYGTTLDEIEQKTGERVYALETLTKGIENVAKTRTAMAADLVARARGMVDSLDSQHDFFRIDSHATIRQYLALAQKFDAEIPVVREALPAIEKALAEDLKKLDVKIASQKWPGNAASAPPDAKALGATILAWFRGSPDWGRNAKHPYTILAVAVTGPWNVQERNILGQPTMHGLPILLAVQRAEDKPSGLARAFRLTICTAERVGVKPAPPFESVRVGDSLLMKATAVK